LKGQKVEGKIVLVTKGWRFEAKTVRSWRLDGNNL